ncbi:hypothetical protein L249_1345 [Ophiocordyceps polyrhachis-furcata BCC 54312]|uniref:Retroviral polymerase SH3-like domain-containing protein n=1 Tax=Ophiocordyceps polyrhachis-furcata BCC 54312 TaxID=1330021 RepID=A0A367LEQ7_9HYPO|nr:hypothetical protein L249_1345 [Ophiocordyceps polyrhachis-furcata BCC 54312]
MLVIFIPVILVYLDVYTRKRILDIKPYRIQSAKIALRAKEGYLVGIEGLYRHIYKVFLLDKDKIVRARDVRFYDPANLNLDRSVTYIANVSKDNNPFNPNDFFYYYI